MMTANTGRLHREKNAIRIRANVRQSKRQYKSDLKSPGEIFKLVRVKQAKSEQSLYGSLHGNRGARETLNYEAKRGPVKYLHAQDLNEQRDVSSMESNKVQPNQQAWYS